MSDDQLVEIIARGIHGAIRTRHGFPCSMDWDNEEDGGGYINRDLIREDARGVLKALADAGYTIVHGDQAPAPCTCPVGWGSVADINCPRHRALRTRSRAPMADPVLIARCPEHGLHGCRKTCFECGEEVEQVAMLTVQEHEAELAEMSTLRDAAQAVEHARASFLSSVPFQPREALWDLFREKLAGPLDSLRAVLQDTRARLVTATALHQTEAQFQQAIIDLARALGWRVFHPFDSRRSNPGFPDLTMARGERLLFAELKTETGKVSDGRQDQAEDRLHAFLAEWFGEDDIPSECEVCDSGAPVVGVVGTAEHLGGCQACVDRWRARRVAECIICGVERHPANMVRVYDGEYQCQECRWGL